MNISKSIFARQSVSNAPFTGRKILIVGASSDIASELNGSLYRSGAMIGLHYNKNAGALSKFSESNSVKKLKKELKGASNCYGLIEEFVRWAGGIDGLVQLSGDVRRPVHWSSLDLKDWNYDLSVNLVMPFFLCQRAIEHMKRSGGRIILMSTASACHGGGAASMAYGVAKSGVETMVKGLARDCAKYNVLVNAVAPGVILTKFHTKRMKRTKRELDDRIEKIPLKRAGTKREFADTVIFLLSNASSYITGQTIAMSGGDWL